MTEEGGSQKVKIAAAFKPFGLSQPVLRAIASIGYKLPTPIQRKAIPVMLSGRDIVAMARTGSGKTAAFMIPLIEKLAAHSTTVGFRAIVLSPTRDLALQTLKVGKQLSKYTTLLLAPIVGGENMNDQFDALSHNPDIIVATPGRLLHHLVETQISLQRVEIIVFDEADNLFELGFAPQISEICARLPPTHQTCLCSATMPSTVTAFVRSGLKENTAVVRLNVEATLSPDLRCYFLTCQSAEKYAALLFLLHNIIPSTDQTLVFAATRFQVEYLAQLLEMTSISTRSVYGALDMEAQKQNLAAFVKKQARVLVVTDIAARGLDLPLLDCVIHFDFPANPKVFIHRTGRTARAGKRGTCYALLVKEEIPYFVDLCFHLGKKPRLVGMEEIKDNGADEMVNTVSTKHGEQVTGQQNAKKGREKKNPDKKDNKRNDNKEGGGEDDEEMNLSDLLDDEEEIPSHPVQSGSSLYSSLSTSPYFSLGTFPSTHLLLMNDTVRNITSTQTAGATVLQNLQRPVNNAYRAYRKERPYATRAGMAEAKRLLSEMKVKKRHLLGKKTDATIKREREREERHKQRRKEEKELDEIKEEEGMDTTKKEGEEKEEDDSNGDTSQMEDISSSSDDEVEWGFSGIGINPLFHNFLASQSSPHSSSTSATSTQGTDIDLSTLEAETQRMSILASLHKYRPTRSYLSLTLAGADHNMPKFPTDTTSTQPILSSASGKERESEEEEEEIGGFDEDDQNIEMESDGEEGDMDDDSGEENEGDSQSKDGEGKQQIPGSLTLADIQKMFRVEAVDDDDPNYANLDDDDGDGDEEGMGTDIKSAQKTHTQSPHTATTLTDDPALAAKKERRKAMKAKQKQLRQEHELDKEKKSMLLLGEAMEKFSKMAAETRRRNAVKREEKKREEREMVTDVHSLHTQSPSQSLSSTPTPKKTVRTDFRDPKFFVSDSYDPSQKRRIADLLGGNGKTSSLGALADLTAQLNQSSFTLASDGMQISRQLAAPDGEAKQQRFLPQKKWDRKKMKFVNRDNPHKNQLIEEAKMQRTMDAETIRRQRKQESEEDRLKRWRRERRARSGERDTHEIKKGNKAYSLSMYEEWRKRTHRSIPTVGVEEEETYSRAQMYGKKKQTGGRTTNKTDRPVKSELKSPQQIAKERSRSIRLKQHAKDVEKRKKKHKK